MILADTSVWIEFLRGHIDIVSTMTALLERCTVCSIECIFGELLQGAKDKEETAVIDAYWQNIPKIKEDGLWIEAGKLSKAMKLPSKGVGLIDAVIIVAANRAKAPIWTLDKKLRNVVGRDDLYAPK